MRQPERKSPRIYILKSRETRGSGQKNVRFPRKIPAGSPAGGRTRNGPRGLQDVPAPALFYIREILALARQDHPAGSISREPEIPRFLYASCYTF